MGNEEIIGCWQSALVDVASLQLYGDVHMEFKSNGDLVYKAISGGKEEIINMIYEIREEGLLVTNQLSFPNEEKTKFTIINDDTLNLFFNDVKSTYVRVSENRDNNYTKKCGKTSMMKKMSSFFSTRVR